MNSWLSSPVKTEEMNMSHGTTKRPIIHWSISGQVGTRKVLQQEIRFQA